MNFFKCAKLLADVSVVQFYPSKFVLITDILDTFGKLVYDRIRTKSFYVSHESAKPQPLPGLYYLFIILSINYNFLTFFVHIEKFSADIVPASAKDTCRNWFFKIASIRELLPRIYVECSIIKCMSYLGDK